MSRVEEKLSPEGVQLEAPVRSLEILPTATAHGFAHLDRLHPYQRKEKSTMATQDYNEALTFAIGDLVKNWSGYRRRYEEWLRQK